eukprot:6387358-Pyramimonas_sp.AAC.2
MHAVASQVAQLKLPHVGPVAELVGDLLVQRVVLGQEHWDAETPQVFISQQDAVDLWLLAVLCQVEPVDRRVPHQGRAGRIGFLPEARVLTQLRAHESLALLAGHLLVARQPFALASGHQLPAVPTHAARLVDLRKVLGLRELVEL